MNGHDAEDFEQLVADRLRRRSRVDQRQVQSLVTFARNLPDRSPAPRRIASPRFRPSFVLAPIVAATIVVGIIWSASVVPGPATGSPTPSIAPASASPSASPAGSTLTPSTTPSALPSLPDPSAWANDARLTSCGGLGYKGARILTIVPLKYAFEFIDLVPAVGYSAELEAPDAALVVVYDGPGPSDGLIQVEGRPEHTVKPGTYDVCVGTAKRAQRFYSLPIDWNVLLRVVAPTPPKVVSWFNDPYLLYGSNLLWDRARGKLWWAFVGCGNAQQSSLNWYDPADGSGFAEMIPSNTFGNCDVPQIGIDDAGKVWVMENSLLLRFDPEADTGLRLKSVRIAPETVVSSRDGSKESYPTAMAFDGDSALVARLNWPYLTRVTADMKIEPMPVSADVAGAKGLAIWGHDLYALTDRGVRVIPLSALPMASPGPTASPPMAVIHPVINPLTIVHDGGVVLWKDLTTGVKLDEQGEELGPVAAPLSPPPFIARAIRSTTDWEGRWWYVVGDYGTAILQVDP